MSTGPRPPVRVIALLALLIALGGVAAVFVRGRRGGATTGPAEWPPFEPRLVPSPEPAAWIAPGPDGTVPDSHPVKVKVRSGIFHVPGGRFYERTRADRLYPNTVSAEADGYRPSKS